MFILRRVFTIILKCLATVLLIAFLAVCVTSISPVYKFAEPMPFSGPDIFNPYAAFDSSTVWKRANFHTHTRVEGLLNECEYWPAEVCERYDKFGYDVVTFSNHNELTVHPVSPELQVNLYEHGYNLFKFHKLVFGADEVMAFDHLLPIFTFQKQFQIDLLAKQSDIIQFNHPLRTHTVSKRTMQQLTGYQIMELDSGLSTENEYWDDALSAGHYCFALANDDLHYPDRSHLIAVRCNFLNTPSARYEDIKNTLLGGCYYSMRVPDYGRGDWEVKVAKNRMLPRVTNIGKRDSTLYISLSHRADSIKVVGQNHTTLSLQCDVDSLAYTMTAEDSYARFVAYFHDGEVIYTNPFARYDAEKSATPFVVREHTVDILLTVLFNLLLGVLFVGISALLYRILKIRVKR